MSLDVVNGTAILVAGAVALAYALYRKGQPSSWTKVVDAEGTRRGADVDQLKADAHGCHTLYESFERASRLYAEKKCTGVREMLEVREETRMVHGEEKPWKTYKKGPYSFKSYAEVFQWALEFGSGLRALGLEPKDHLAIYNETSVEWTLAEQACYAQSITVLTVYANLGKEGVRYAIQEAKVTHILAGGVLLDLLATIAEECPSLECIIYTKGANEDSIRKLEKNAKLISFEDVVELGKANFVDPVPPSPEDLACIMYTSGSTGNPKGVMISHGNMTSAVGGYGSCFQVEDDDRYLNYLPLAHVLAMVIENACIHYGAAIGYGSPLTLTDTNMVKGCKGDMRELQPTAFAGVPLVYDKIKAGIVKQVGESSAAVQLLFKVALAIKKWATLRGRPTPLLDLLVFGKFRTLLGGKMKWMVTGGAPLSYDAHLYLRACFGIPLNQGYGLTETCGAGAVMRLGDLGLANVGGPVPCVEIKLVDVPEMGYTSESKPNPQGEIWMRGPCISKGYYQNKEKTDEVFVDGWFRTGDIGQWNANGSLQIIDRIKNLIKGPHGEYIALEKLESIYKNCPWVASACVYASSEHPHNVALVQPQLPKVMAWAEANGKEKNFSKLCKDPEMAKQICVDLNAAGKAGGLKRFELLKEVIICEEEWTPNNNLLTAAMKLNRQKIYKTFQKEIDAAYA